MAHEDFIEGLRNEYEAAKAVGNELRANGALASLKALGHDIVEAVEAAVAPPAPETATSAAPENTSAPQGDVETAAAPAADFAAAPASDATQSE